MKRAGGLNMGVIVVDAQLGSAAEHRFNLPAGIRITVPPFSGSGIEHHSIQGDAERIHFQHGGFGCDLGFGRHQEVVILRRDTIGIPSVRELRIVIGNAVGANQPVVAFDADGYAVGGAAVGARLAAGSIIGCARRVVMAGVSQNGGREYSQSKAADRPLGYFHNFHDSGG
jgi:hypothetical protein